MERAWRNRTCTDIFSAINIWITPSVHLHTFYVAKTVFIKIEVYCAGKKMSTLSKNPGHCLFHSKAKTLTLSEKQFSI